MSLECQKHLFNLPEDLHYLNGAYMSPLLKSAEEAGIRGLKMKQNPASIGPTDYFDHSDTIRRLYSSIINCRPSQVAIIPSASYGLSSAFRNTPANGRSKAITIQSEFPSDYFALRRWCDTHKVELVEIHPEPSSENRAQLWNEKILDAIDEETAVVNISAVHWMDGTKYVLKEIGKKCQEVGAIFIVDGTQSVGAAKMDVEECNIDALICASYKWLHGPYSFGLAYYSEKYNNGIPIEETWMNRTNAQNFSTLTEYDVNYKPDAGRYNVGETSNFIASPIMITALEQIIEWDPEEIQNYCSRLAAPLFDFLSSNGIGIESAEYRSSHLFSIRMPQGFNIDSLVKDMKMKNVSVSARGQNIRVSPSVYNTKEDIAALQSVISESILH